MYDLYYQSFLEKDFEPQGLPIDYPVPCKDGLLFYIQNNSNVNTVVYEVNTNEQGQMNLNMPMKVYWIKYHDCPIEKELNYIQFKLAYGYDSRIINNDLIEFNFVCYNKTFYIHKLRNNQIKVVTKINGRYSYLENIYVYAEEFGAFPSVKFVEFYGQTVECSKKIYEKVII